MKKAFLHSLGARYYLRTKTKADNGLWENVQRRREQVHPRGKYVFLNVG